MTTNTHTNAGALPVTSQTLNLTPPCY